MYIELSDRNCPYPREKKHEREKGMDVRSLCLRIAKNVRYKV